jgi:glutaredoxin-like protein NrdH
MKLYTKTICPKCLWVKSELERRGLEAEIINIEKDDKAKQIILNAGFLSVPVMELNGDLIGDTKQMMEQIELLAP